MVFNPDSNWELGYNSSNNNLTMKEYVLKGQNVYNWNQMITLQSLKGIQAKTTTKLFANNFLAMLKQSDKTLKSRIIEANDNNIILIWSISGNKLVEKQTEIVRIIKGDEAMYIAHFAIKKNPVKKEQLQKMTSVIKNISVSNK